MQVPKIADALDQISRLDKGRPRKTVLILGAGMAGLASAFELSSLGHSVEILEGSKRVGGRVWTHRFPSGQYHELGAMRIPASHDYTRHYVETCGLRLRRFVSSHQNLNCFYDIRDVQTRIADAPRTLFGRFRLSPAERRLATTAVAPALFGQLMSSAIDSLSDRDEDSMFGDEVVTERSRELDDLSLGEFLEKGVRGEDTRALIGATTALEVWWDRAITMFLRDEIRGGDGLEEIEGGMDLLPTRLAQKLPPTAKLHLETEVTAINRLETGARVRVRTPEGEAEKTYDYIICTIPFPVLRRIHLEGFSEPKLEAIRNLSYASSTKVLIHCKERFWETKYGIFGGASLSDKITRSTYYPSDNVAGPVSPSREKSRGVHTTFAKEATSSGDRAISHGPGVLVGSYCWEADARRLGGLSQSERVRVSIDAIARFHPEIAAQADDGISMNWDDNKWSGGAFSFLRPGDHRRYFRATVAPEGNIMFAGEHCSTDQAWIQGALVSALRTVIELVGR